MDPPSVYSFKTVIVDSILCASLASFIFYWRMAAKTFRRGFFCDDESIRYPRLQSTVPYRPLQLGGMSIAILLIFIGEYLARSRSKKTSSPHFLDRFKDKAFYWSVYQKLACLVSGLLFTLLLTELPKKVIGRLRPNFIAVCGIDVETVCSAVPYTYITDYTCPNEGIEVEKSRVSFPSGHSSFSFYVAIFIALYLEKRFKIRIFLLKPVIQFLLILLAWYVALSRVSDNKHHWSDVLSGMLVGSFVAVINTVFLHRMFQEEKPSADNSANENQNNDDEREA